MVHSSFVRRALARCAAASALAAASVPALAGQASEAPALLGIPIDFILFGFTLLGVPVFHHYTLQVALTGLAAIVAYKLGFTGFKTGPGITGLAAHMLHEWVILTNLLGLLVGFAVLSNHFEKSHVPAVLPRFLPDDWKGGFVLLAAIQVLFTYTLLLNDWFGTSGIDLAAWLGILACAAAIFVLVELEKAIIRRATAPTPAV